MTFSADTRRQWLDKAESTRYDLIVIGGGITGAGILLDAVTRGLKVLLLEKHDFAFGTSSRSTKLIHGGLRYLKQLEFALVSEVGRERAIVHNLAPHLVIPEKMLLPLMEGKSMGYLLTSFGLRLYDWLARVRGDDRRRMLTGRETLRAEPLLDPKGITGGALYSEYRTDDARLTTEIIKTAIHHGAVAINYAEVTQLTYTDGQVSGVQVRDHSDGRALAVQGKVVVNATGPWVDTIRGLDGSRSGKRLHLSKGIHVVVGHPKFPVRQAIYFEVPDGRMIFAIPRAGKTYIGTTDTDYHGSLEEVVAETDEVEYLLKSVAAVFPSIRLSQQDVEATWAGLRPLIHEDGKSPGELSRKDEIFESPSRLISIAGGKLTGYRKMAERVVDLVVEQGGFSSGPCVTEHTRLEESFESFEAYRSFRKQLMAQQSDPDLQHKVGQLCDIYGRAAQEIVRHATTLGGGSLMEEHLLRAELKPLHR